MIPTGWKLVPVDLVPAMSKAMADMLCSINSPNYSPIFPGEMEKTWTAALSAAPPPPEPDEAMVERVARAMEPELWSVTDGFTTITATHARLESMHKARAAIAAMKEPQ